MKRLILPSIIILITLLACQFSINVPETPSATPGTPAGSANATDLPSFTKSPSITAPSSPTTTPRPNATLSSTRPAATPLQPTPIVIPAGGEQPVLISGEFTYSNDFVVETYYVEHAIALVDLYGFIIRDEEWELPVDSQVLGYLKIDPEKNRGSYQVQLPLLPAGTYFDFTRSSGKKPGVQVFAVAYQPNLYGGPFAVGDDRSLGWPSYLASIATDTENKYEVTGGKLVVWAPDDQQQFPTSFGTDGLLFTADDPLGPLPAGYAVIDLDQQPFKIDRSPNPRLALYEPKDIAVKDYSKLSYSEAFLKMVDFLRKEYAFNGIAGKEPDWDKLTADLLPRIKAAEAAKDAEAYYVALLDFTLSFKDGHVQLDGDKNAQAYLNQQLAYGYGFAIRELDDGRAIVVFVTRNGSAQAAGIEVGAELLTFNGMPVKEAISKVRVLSPESSDFSLRYEQARYLSRAVPGTGSVTVTFKTRAGATRSATLRATNERTSFYATSIFRDFDSAALPVEFRILDSGSGYIKVNSNYDDLNLIVRLFERALKTFVNEGVDKLIIDMRSNTGGSPLGLAGFLTDHEILLGTSEYYNEKTGKFEPEGKRDKFTPNENQYRFRKMALLVDQACFSACELEAYGFSQLPGMVVVGMFPTAGVEAEVARGQFSLPEGMSAQFPTGRFVLPDGSLFLEGQGVKPTVRVPLTAENVLSEEDVVLDVAEQRLK